MIPYQKDIRLSVASLLLVCCMALPSVLKLSHAIHDHLERQCKEDIALHFHETEFDCEFQKFKLSQQFYPPLLGFEIQPPLAFEEANYSLYSFLSNYQKLHFSLRGPPAFS